MPIPDPFESQSVGLTSPASYAVDITPHDTNDLPFRPRGITCLVAGTIRVEWPDGTASNHTIAAGAVLPLRPNKIRATGTAATGIAIVK